MTTALSLADVLGASGGVRAHRPWRRAVLDDAAWRSVGERLAAGELSLVGEWAERDAVHAALYDGETFAVTTVLCRDGRFPSLGRLHPPALRLERAIRDLFGLEPEGLPDARPWLLHGEAPYEFLPVEGESLHQIPVGPVHAGIIEPGHFRFTASGETIVRLEARLGYVHKGIESLMAGAALERAARLAGRTSGDSTVAYALAFARAAEAALGVDAPARAHWLRALMAELERLANHLGDIGAICNDAAFALMHARCAMLRERVLRAADDCFGHRLMRDCVVPGGVTVDVDAERTRLLRELVSHLAERLPALIEIYENTASLQDRTVGTGVLDAALARQFAAGGYVGRASGRAFDARRHAAYPPYDELELAVPVLEAGDVNARVWIRIREAQHCLELIGIILERLPGGAIRSELDGAGGSESRGVIRSETSGAIRGETDRARPAEIGNPGETLARREGVALVEGFRGDVLAWVALAPDGTVERCHLRDPSWFQWPLLEAAIEGNIVADFPLCNKSFNCSYSGHDL